MSEGLGVNIKECREFNKAESIETLLWKVRHLCKSRRANFPGSQPISLSAANVRRINDRDYVVCEKTDGVRYLMYLAQGCLFLVDRKEDVIVIKMHMPCANENVTHSGTLLDGELVLDVSSEGLRVKRLLIFDAIAINEIHIGDRNLMARLAYAMQEVVLPRRAWIAENKAAVEQEIATNNHLELYLKDFYAASDVKFVSVMANARFPHFCDGVIFTNVNSKYKAGTCDTLKWKPAHLNSVDWKGEILIHPDTNLPVACRLHIGVNGMQTPCGDWLALEGQMWEKIKEAISQGDYSYDNAVIECFWEPNTITKKLQEINEQSPKDVKEAKRLRFCSGSESQYVESHFREVENGGWVIERIRKDKRTPNDQRVAMKVRESIRDNISLDKLAEFIRSNNR